MRIGYTKRNESLRVHPANVMCGHTFYISVFFKYSDRETLGFLLEIPLISYLIYDRAQICHAVVTNRTVSLGYC